MRSFLLIVACLLVIQQACFAKGADRSLEQISRTEWFRSFDSLANYLELAGKDVAVSARHYRADQYLELETAYNAAATEMNGLLSRMAEDLTHRRRRKFIEADPDAYIKSYLYDLQQAKEHATAGFLNLKRKYDLEQRLYTFSPLIIVPFVKGCIELTREIKRYIKDMRHEQYEHLCAELSERHGVVEFKKLSAMGR